MFTIRSVQPDDLPFLWDMLWEAAAVDFGVRDLDTQAVLAMPEIQRYLEGWGRPGDTGFVACSESGLRLGAAWFRLFPADAPGYGFVAPDVPELGIGVMTNSRGQGIGSALIDALLAAARSQSHRAISLGVLRQNPARALYERKGFRDAHLSDPSGIGLTMIASL